MRSPRARLGLSVVCLLLGTLCILPLGAQTLPVPGSPVPQPTDSVVPELTEMDIRTSTLLELVQWCRRLGLSEGGTAQELADRLRSYYGIKPTLAAPEPGNPTGPSTEKTGQGTQGTLGSAGTPRTITIESARNSEYFTLKVVNEEYARLTGTVVLTLKDGETVYRLSADEIVYNRTRDSLSATGHVEYTKEGGGTVETFKGESLVIHLDDWSGVFIHGVSERSLTGQETAYRFAGDLISRSADDVTVLKDAVIGNAKTEDQYWSINASKLWLLPGSDWAILNGVLKVGEIPVLYIPFFYLPGDEVIFHPVLGFRSREGTFVQTTTYLLGRPKASSSSESSITKILGSGAETERKQEGLFLRSTGKRIKNPDETSLSVLFDAYTNLGGYLGTKLKIPKKGIVGPTNLEAGLGLTRTVYQIGSNYYSPFTAYSPQSDWNRSKFFLYEIPFRYRIKASGSIKTDATNLTWSFPFYADPYVEQDFMNRSEAMDWFSMLNQSTTSTGVNNTIPVLPSYEWRISDTTQFPVANLKPYVNSLAITNATSYVTFNTRASTLYSADSSSPNRTFFYPDKFTLFSLSASVAGRPYESSGASTSPGTGKGGTAEDPLQGWGTLRSPWLQDSSVGSQAVVPQSPLDSPRTSLSPPPLSQSFDMASKDSPLRFAVDYAFTPAMASELQFRSSQENWPEANNVAWNQVSSILTTVKNTGSTTFTVTDPRLSLSTALTLSGTAAVQGYSYLNEQAEEFDTPSELDSAKLRVYNATYFTTSSELAVTEKPFSQDPVWGGTNIQYNLKGLLAKSVFTGTSQAPTWDVQYGSWTKNDIEKHFLAFNLEALVRDKTQNLSLSADLPPKDTTVYGTTALRAWLSTTKASASVFDPLGEAIYKPVTFSETVDFGAQRSLSQSGIYDPELGQFTSLVSSATFGGLTTAFTATYDNMYELDPIYGWKAVVGTQQLRPKSFTLGYTNSTKGEPLWRDRFTYSLDISSNLSLDLQRYTYSSLFFSLGTTVRVAQFLDLSFSAKSQNAVVFRYLQGLPWWNTAVDLPGQENFLMDLVNSFRFDNEELRKSSGFKLKALSFGATHYLGDWNAKLGVDLVPYLDTTTAPFRYKFNTQVSFLVQWVPITEIKTEVASDYTGFYLK